MISQAGRPGDPVPPRSTAVHRVGDGRPRCHRGERQPERGQALGAAPDDAHPGDQQRSGTGSWRCCGAISARQTFGSTIAGDERQARPAHAGELDRPGAGHHRRRQRRPARRWLSGISSANAVTTVSTVRTATARTTQPRSERAVSEAENVRGGRCRGHDRRLCGVRAAAPHQRAVDRPAPALRHLLECDSQTAPCRSAVLRMWERAVRAETGRGAGGAAPPATLQDLQVNLDVRSDRSARPGYRASPHSAFRRSSAGRCRRCSSCWRSSCRRCWSAASAARGRAARAADRAAARR